MLLIKIMKQLHNSCEYHLFFKLLRAQRANTINQSINQSINQINQSIDQSINQSFNQSINDLGEFLTIH